MSDPSEPLDHRDVEALAETAYSLSLRMLTQQETVFVDLRNRTGTLAALGAVVASLLIPEAFDERHSPPVFASIGLVLFGVSVSSILMVIWPRTRLYFEFRGTQAWKALYGHPAADQKRTLAYWLEGYYDRNIKTINAAFWWYRGAVASLVLAVMAWGLQILLL